MCYILDQEQIKPVLAEEDIKVFKIGYKSKEGYFVSLIRRSISAFDKVQMVPEFWKYITDDTVLEGEFKTSCGLYSYANQGRAEIELTCNIRNMIVFSKLGLRIFEAIIPKGSMYIMTGSGYCISDQLIVKDEIVDFYPKLNPKFIQKYKDSIASYVPENILEGKE